MPTRPYSILNVPIMQLSIKDDFKVMASVNGFDTLQQVLNFPVSVLLKREKFTMHVYYELIDVLKQNDILNSLKQF